MCGTKQQMMKYWLWSFRRSRPPPPGRYGPARPSAAPRTDVEAREFVPHSAVHRLEDSVPASASTRRPTPRSAPRRRSSASSPNRSTSTPRRRRFRAGPAHHRRPGAEAARRRRSASRHRGEALSPGASDASVNPHHPAEAGAITVGAGVAAERVDGYSRRGGVSSARISATEPVRKFYRRRRHSGRDDQTAASANESDRACTHRPPPGHLSGRSCASPTLPRRPQRRAKTHAR